MAEFTCGDCKQTKPIETKGGTGYAKYGEAIVCYSCCAIRDTRTMEGAATGEPFYLYLTGSDNGGWKLTNWPGTLAFTPTRVKKSRHNFGCWRHDVWFNGPGGSRWHGVNIGDMDLTRCRKLKSNPT